MNGQLSFSAGDSPDDEPRLLRGEVLDRWRFLAKVGQWPPARHADPERWLTNFHHDEQEVALALLNALMYFNDEMTERLLETAIRQIAPQVSTPGATYAHRKAQWLKFLTTMQITHLLSPEDQHDETKSGYVFARKSRQILSSADQVRPAADIAAELFGGAQIPTIVVDDFAGTGNKFIEGWNRNYELADGSKVSYAQLAKGGAQIFFCPAVCTASAVRAIAQLPDPPIISTAHVLSDEMSIVHQDSEVMPTYLRDDTEAVVRAASARCGTEEPPLGWGDLALAVSFSHNTPDTTLPIFYSEDNDWYPIVRRR